MSYPPPPGTSSLPPRPPPSIHASTHAFAGFKPRQVASSNQPIGAPPTYSGVPGVSAPPNYGVHGMPGGPQPAAGASYGYGAQPQAQTSYSAPQTTYSAAPTANSRYMNSNQPQHTQSQYGQHNQGGSRGGYQNRNTGNQQRYRNTNSDIAMDPELEAQIAEQQSIYDPARRAALAAAAAANATTTSAGYDPNTSLLPDGQAPTPAQSQQKKATVLRSGGGQTWKDDTLLEWDPAHFRLFVGNLAGEVTDESLLKAFAAYPSVQKARVIRDKRTTKSKGYGFVAFQDGDDYFKAAREMQGKYIGSHPVLLRKSTTEIRPTVAGKKNKKDKHKGSGGGGGANAGAGNGILGKKEGGGVVKVKKEKGPKLLG